MIHPAADFCNRLRRLRRVRGYTQAELIRCVGTSQVRDWEAGRSKPGFDHLVSLGEVLDVSLDELMRGEK
ncbi:MAG: helix-turn-helix transcriptional regulator [Pseudomonadota bacterium]|nr:helix-turn-helix transcriptional regulator [Pseudomonadota bacterium]